jgi:hypothetical protein
MNFSGLESRLLRTLACAIACTGICFSQGSGYFGWFKDLKGENAGHTVGLFLTLPVGAGQLGSAEVSSSGMMDATDVPLFPANTALFSRQKISVTHLEWFLGTRMEYAGACFPVPEIGTIGVFSKVFTAGSFDNARNIDQEVSHPVMVDVALGGSFARHFLDRTLSLGACLAYVESRLDVASGRSVAATVDAAYRPIPFVNAHAFAANFGPPMKYTSVKEPLPGQLGVSADLYPLEAAGAEHEIFDFSLGLGVRKTADEPLSVGAGLRAILKKQFFLRTGYEYSIQNHPSIEGFSAGTGIEVSRYGADFGWQYRSKDLGPVWSLSVKMNFKEIAPKTAEDYFKAAQQAYAKGRVRQCVSNAKRALALDPNMWKAHELIALVTSEQRREQNLEIGLIYTGNIKGQFVPLALARGTIGGLSRQATAVRTLMQQFPTHVVIDGGNGITEHTQPIKVQLARFFFDELGYDAVSIGEKEFLYGLPKFSAASAEGKAQYVASNVVSGFGLGPIVTKKVVTVNGYGFFIASAISPSLAGKPEDQDRLAPVRDALTKALSSSDSRGANVRICIVHDSWDNVKAYAADLSRADIILCSSLKQEFASPMKAGSSLVLSTGESGKYVGLLVMRFSNEKALLSCENRLFALTEDVAPDSVIEAKTRLIVAQAEADTGEERLLRRSSADGVFAFCSKRRGETGIFLKVIAKNAEFALAAGKNDCASPVVSFAASRIVYVEKHPDSPCTWLNIMDASGTDKRRVEKVSCPKSAVFSPDGRWLYIAAKAGDSTSDIVRVRPDGVVIEPVVTWKNSDEGFLDLSPDNRSMVFGSNSNGKWQLFLSDEAGRSPVCITDGSADFISPRFSPDSRNIALLSSKTSFGGTLDLWVYDCASSRMSQLTVRAKVRDFCWLDNARIIASARAPARELVVIDIATQRSTALIPTYVPKQYAEATPSVTEYRGSVKIVYTREYGDMKKQIWWVNPDGTGDQCLVNSNGQDWLE